MSTPSSSSQPTDGTTSMRTLRIVDHECNLVTNIDQSIDVSKVCAVYLQGIPPNDGDEMLRRFLTSAGHPLATSFPENPRTMLNPLHPEADPAIGGLCGWGHYQSSAGAQWAYPKAERWSADDRSSSVTWYGRWPRISTPSTIPCSTSLSPIHYQR